MFRALGCLVFVLVAAAAGWYAKGVYDSRMHRKAAGVDSASWKAMSTEGARRAEAELSSLARGNREFVELAPADLASHVLAELGGKFSGAVSGIRSTVEGDRVAVRGTVNLEEIGARSMLGPLASLLKDTEEVYASGTFRVVRPGLAEFRVAEVRVRDLPVPSPLIPPLIRKLGPAERPEGIPDHALPVNIPEHVQDIRIAEGKILVYRRAR